MLLIRILAGGTDRIAPASRRRSEFVRTAAPRLILSNNCVDSGVGEVLPISSCPVWAFSIRTWVFGKRSRTSPTNSIGSKSGKRGSSKRIPPSSPCLRSAANATAPLPASITFHRGSSNFSRKSSRRLVSVLTMKTLSAAREFSTIVGSSRMCDVLKDSPLLCQDYIRAHISGDPPYVP